MAIENEGHANCNLFLLFPSTKSTLWGPVGYLLKKLFLTSELANKVEITILSLRDTTSAWAPGQGIIARDVGVYKTGYNTWLSSRLQNQPRSFRFVSLFSYFFFR